VEQTLRRQGYEELGRAGRGLVRRYLEKMTGLEAMLRQFLFCIRGFHSDNGSEFVNHTVAKLRNKLLVEQTKSRPRYGASEIVVAFANDGVAGIPGVLRVYVESPDGAFPFRLSGSAPRA
jgi:hypothetical protein